LLLISPHLPRSPQTLPKDHPACFTRARIHQSWRHNKQVCSFAITTYLQLETYYDIYIEHLTLSRKEFAYYEIWISPYGANNQNKPQVHEKTMIINLLISYKYKYQKLCCHTYRNLEYELLKLKFNSTNSPKLRNHLTF